MVGRKALSLVVMLGLFGLASCTSPLPKPETVASVDVQRYAGVWFEAARIPTVFEDGMGTKCADAKATYTLRPDGRIDIRNACRNLARDGREDVTDGVAEVDDPTGAKLAVTFLWPFSAPYWVIGLDPDYRWAVVGSPSRKYLWVLSRSPQMTPDDEKAATSIADKQQFDVSRLVWARGARP